MDEKGKPPHKTQRVTFAPDASLDSRTSKSSSSSSVPDLEGCVSCWNKDDMWKAVLKRFKLVRQQPMRIDDSLMTLATMRERELEIPVDVRASIESLNRYFTVNVPAEELTNCQEGGPDADTKRRLLFEDIEGCRNALKMGEENNTCIHLDR